jgi:RND family efflux transporter MFP subunit
MKIEEDYDREVAGDVEPAADEGHGKPRGRLARALLIVLLGALGVAAVVVSGIIPRLRDRKTVAAETLALAVPSVSVVHPTVSAPSQEIVLPASVQAFIDAPIYARTNGYLKKWYFDIGAHVKSGQLLAEIDTPEVDAQLKQARADLATAQANLHLAAITAARYQELLKTDSVSRQDTDNATSDLAAKQTAEQSAASNVKRLEDLQSFEKIYAPFDGVITARNTDIGQLIDSGSSGGAARELFHIQDVSKLRVFVDVPQVYSRAARPGLSVDLTLPEYPERRFQGSLVRTADAIDPASRTLRVEIDVDNSKNQLLPGGYAEAHFKLPVAGSSFILPSNTLIFRAQGLQIATVNDGHHALLKSIQLGRDFGNRVEVVSGLNQDDLVIVDPPDSLVSGETVRPIEPVKGGDE